MAEPEAPAAAEEPPSPKTVAKIFLNQYYTILQRTPHLAHKWYEDHSRVSRPSTDGAGEMDSVTTKEAINEKIMGMPVTMVEIKSLDSQESHEGGLTVLVRGHLTGGDGVRREFMQFFFLAPQPSGYFVLNDMLRYVEDGFGNPIPAPDAAEVQLDVADGTTGAAVEPAAPDLDAVSGTELPVTEHPLVQPEEEVYIPPEEYVQGPAVVEEQSVTEGFGNPIPAPDAAEVQVDVVVPPSLASGTTGEAVEPAAPDLDVVSGTELPVTEHPLVQPDKEVHIPPPAEDVQGPAVVEEQSVTEVIAEVPDNVAPVPHEGAPKKSYASIVKEVPLPAPVIEHPVVQPKKEVYIPPEEYVQGPAVVEEQSVTEVIDEAPDNVAPVPQGGAPKKSYASIVKEVPLPAPVMEHPVVQPKKEVYIPPEEYVQGPAVVEEQSVTEVIDEAPDNVAPVPQGGAPKKSYALIVKEVPLPALASSGHVVPKPEKQSPGPPAPTPAADVLPLSSNNGTTDLQEPEVVAHVVYVRSLPLNATPEQLEEEFKQFGTVKHDSTQVRSHKVQGFCYGLVEFEESCSVQSAIKAKSVMIGGRECFIEEKRTHDSRGSGRGRSTPGRGSNLRTEGAKGRSNYGGRSCGRGDLSNRSEYGGQSGAIA